MLPMTKPMDDELVCSALVRCCRTFRLPFKTLAREVLGLPGLRANFYSTWPMRPLATLLGTSDQELLWKHTHFGFATAFLIGPSYILACQVAMTGMPHMSLLSAVMQNVTSEVGLRRLCPECVQAELAARGEAYWHRSHNIPGVLSCSVHGCPLRETDIEASATLKTVYTLPHECKRTRSLAVPATAAQRRLESRALELLSREPGHGARRDASFYRDWATEFGWLNQSRDVSEDAVKRLIKGAYSPRYLRLCGIEAGRWAAHAFRPTVPSSASPLRHLLLESALSERQADDRGSLDYVSTGPPGTLPSSADAFYARAAKRELRAALRSYETLSTEQFLRRAGAYGAYHHRGDSLPLLRSVVLEFRASRASVKPLASGRCLFLSRANELVP